jgi:hypothetical protein
MFDVLAINGMHFHVVLVLQQVKYTIDFFRSGERLMVHYSNVCGFVGLSVYDTKIGIDWKWQAVDGVITKAPLGGKRYGCKSYRQSYIWY